MRHAFFLFCLAIVCIPTTGLAQPNRVPIEVTPESEEFKEATQAFRDHIKKMREIAVHFNSGTSLEENKWRTEWREQFAEGIPLFEEMLHAGIREFNSDPENKIPIAKWLFQIVEERVEKDRFEGLLPVIKGLINDKPAAKELMRQLGMIAMANNDYETATDAIGKLRTLAPDDEMFISLEKELIDLKVAWVKEQELRSAEAEGDPLPRVRVNTTKGSFEIELFEDNAPNTVANFLYLIDSGVYDNMPFATARQHFLILAGDDNTDQPPYTIAGEMNQPNSRLFFRGNLGMAIAGHPDTGYAQFFIALLPNMEMHKTYANFGRVVKGMGVVSSLNMIDPEAEEEEGAPKKEPDEILSMEIIRKRDHVYEPERIER